MLLKRPRWHRRALVLAVACVAVAACSDGDDDAAVPTAAPSATIAVPVTPVTVHNETTLASTTQPTEVATTAVATDEVGTAVADTTTPTTQAPTSTSSLVPTSTEPIAVQELVLTGDGLGSAMFGADPDAVIEYVSSILGSDTGDTGWVDPFSFAACDGGIARRVDWGVLSLLFSDLSGFANGRRHFMGYEYGRVGEIGDEPAGLRTPGGITLGSRVVDLLAEFPDATVNPGEPASGFPDNFYVSDVFYGLLTGTTNDDYVTVLFGGYGCGE